MNETLKTYDDLITRHACVALKKVRQPSEYDLDDFIQEGNFVLLRLKKENTHDSKKSSFRTYFTMILRQHLGDLVLKSYRKRNTVPYDKIAASIHSAKKGNKSTYSTFDIIAMRYILQDFTPEEFEYVQTVFLFVDCSIGSRRKFVRAKLGISYDRERELRNSIHDKILK